MVKIDIIDKFMIKNDFKGKIRKENLKSITKKKKKM